MMILTPQTAIALSKGFFKKPTYSRDLELRSPLSKFFPSVPQGVSWFVFRLCRRKMHTYGWQPGGRRYIGGPIRQYGLRSQPRTISTEYVVATIDWQTGAVTPRAPFPTRVEALRKAQELSYTP